MPCRPDPYGVAMSDRAPFFEPRRPPSDEPEEPRRFVNHPWMPPLNVVPALLAVDLEVVATDAVVARVADVRVYDRGMLLEVEAWLHPDSAADVLESFGMPDEPRVGLLLGDGTRLGAGDPGTSPDVASVAEAPLFIQNGGGAGELRVQQSWWVSPVPEGDAELVLEWDALGVPETFVPLDLAAIRAAAPRARELWPLPDAHGEEFTWVGYAPWAGTAYTPAQAPATGGDG